MAKKTPLQPADLHGLSRLAIDATLGITNIVATMHHTIARAPGILGTPPAGSPRGITGLVYGSICGITRLVGGGIDTILAPLIPLLGEQESSLEREGILAALNGVLGDYLAASDNPLTIPMQLRRDGQALELEAQTLSATLPQPSGKILLLVHGLCLHDLNWRQEEHDHGALLATDLGYTPVYLRYNTGLHISTNGHALADMLEALLHCWPAPVEELAIIGHSMGGLVARSASHYGAVANHAWLQRLRKMILLGTPHHGAPLEQLGNWAQGMLGISPYTAPFARLSKVRSAGITDLRYGNLVDEDWAAQDRFAPARDQRRPTPLPNGVQCYTVGATTGSTAGDLQDQLLGDGLVPLPSALGYHSTSRLTLPFPESHQWIGYEMNHMDLLHRRDVYEQMRQWLGS
ncbi:MAG: GPI inositol-deacylase [Chloroflexales bacterium]|nr:GPI inositol-deacylase [Chloroflexales bacterium]